MDMAALIDRAVARATTARPKPADPTDAQIEAAVMRLARAGYEPSETIMPPVRDLLTGYSVLLSGNPGTGKTFFFRAIGRRIQTAEEICAWGLDGVWQWHEQWDGHEVVIDDLGAEREASAWGVKDDLLKAVLAWRAERQAGRTHVTTNLSAIQIRTRYGDRTLSRILGMCRCHRLDGSDRRKAVAIID